MENRRKRLICIFICLLGAATIIHFYLNSDWKSTYWETRSRRETPRLSPQPSPQPLPASPAAEPGPQWEDPGPYHVAYPGNYTFIMDDTPTCKNTTPFLLLFVPISPGDLESRQVIRKTWGNEKLVLGQRVETLFILGRPGGPDAERQQESLQQESWLHRDLVQSDFRDSYHNLTIKTMVMLEWLAAHCANVSYFIKIDSDVFLHVPNLVKLLLDPGTARQNYSTGLVWWHSPVIRDPLIRFYMPRYVISEQEYPPYALGMAYVMSLDLPRKILGVSSQIEAINIEDAYLALCMKRLGLSPIEPPDKNMFLVEPSHPLSSCSLSTVIAAMTQNNTQMAYYWFKSKQPVKC